tara:strand:+ start:273 stop:524 length:252 start_codon:yes stop_codon:yes gene_type:complete
MELHKENNIKKNKADKFIEFAERRVNNAIKCIQNVGRLSNKASYAYNEDQVRQIINALRAEIKDIESKFESNSSHNTNIFKLK